MYEKCEVSKGRPGQTLKWKYWAINNYNSWGWVKEQPGTVLVSAAGKPKAADLLKLLGCAQMKPGIYRSLLFICVNQSLVTKIKSRLTGIGGKPQPAGRGCVFEGIFISSCSTWTWYFNRGEMNGAFNKEKTASMMVSRVERSAAVGVQVSSAVDLDFYGLDWIQISSSI